MSLDIRLIPRSFMLSSPVEAAYQPEVRLLCRHPYPNHPNGCPNYGKKPDCPPQAPRFINVYQPIVRVVAAIFDFGEYLRQKRELHPGWTDRALRNPRHWQGHLRAELRRYLAGIIQCRFSDKGWIIRCPEAMGINLTETCERAGLTLEWPPQNKVCEIALIGQSIE